MQALASPRSASPSATLGGGITEALEQPVRMRAIRHLQTRLLQHQARGRITGRTADENLITGLTAAAGQRRAMRHEAHDLHGDTQLATGGVTAHQGTWCWRASASSPSLNCSSQFSSADGSANASSAQAGLCAHGGKIGKIHRQGTMPDGAGGRAFGKVHLLDQRIDGGDQLRSWRALQHRAIITHPQHHIGTLGAAVTEVAANEIDFRQSAWIACCALSVRAGEECAPARSSTAFTNL